MICLGLLYIDRAQKSLDEVNGTRDEPVFYSQSVQTLFMNHSISMQIQS